MLENALDISIQEKYVINDARRHQLPMQHYFFIQRWSSDDVPCTLYTKQELRKLHRTLGYPSVRALEIFSVRLKGCDIDRSVANALEKITNDLKYAQNRVSPT